MQDKIPGAERVYEITPDGASSIAALILAAVGAGNQKSRIPQSGMAAVMWVRLVGAVGVTVTDPITTQVTTIPAGADPFTLWGPEAADKVLTGGACEAIVAFRYKGQSLV